MCGIAGLVEDRVSQSVLRSMARRLAHRGPDGEAISLLADGRVGFAHRRLAIIDLSEHGAQPMRSPRGSEIIYNGEIYNYVELRSELVSRGVEFRGHSDTEVLLAAYETWGIDFLSRLNGMFAFAIFDPQERRLLLARDRFGEKPLYYHRTNGTFAFASEIKALFEHPAIRPQADEEAIYRFLMYREVDRDPRTMFDGIRALPPAHVLTLSLDSGLKEIRRYWELPIVAASTRPDGELVQEYRELLADSVRLRLRADVPVGSSLSGGLDSSAIVGLIAEVGLQSGQHTFSARFPGSAQDEGRYISDVRERAAAVGHEVAPDPECIPVEIERLVYHQEHPILSLSVYAQWSVMRLAKDSGVTVLLDGQGADESLAGYQWYLAPHLRDLLAQRRLAQIPRTVSRHLRGHGFASLPTVLYHLLPGSAAQRAKTLVRAVGLNPEFARAHRAAAGRYYSPQATHLGRSLHTTLVSTVLPPLLRYADRNSMAFSREVRLPFLDHRLVEFSFALPDHLKLDGGLSKVVLRRAVDDLLPCSVASRRDKIGYAPPHADWLGGPLHDWVGDIIHSAGFRERPWIDAKRAQSAWRAFTRGAMRYQPDLLRWVNLEIWAKLYLDGRFDSVGVRP